VSIRFLYDAGDTNGDGHDDVAIGWGPKQLLSGPIGGKLQLQEWANPVAVYVNNVDTAWIEHPLPDLDGDGGAEIFVQGDFGGGTSLGPVILFSPHDDEPPPLRGVALDPQGEATSFEDHGDLDGDGIDEVVVRHLHHADLAGTIYVFSGAEIVEAWEAFDDGAPGG